MPTRKGPRPADRDTIGAASRPRVLPSGPLTFVFTDIEGSTRLLAELREGYAEVLADQADLVRGRAAAWGGIEVDTQGDAFFLVFERAVGATAFAADLQRALAAYAGAGGVTVRLRIGLHTGVAHVARTGYVGMDVHRAARIAAAAHGGQVVLSDATRMALEALGDRSALRDIGVHRLKDLPEPEQVWQLEIAGLPADFPPLRSLDTPESEPEPE